MRILGVGLVVLAGAVGLLFALPAAQGRVTAQEVLAQVGAGAAVELQGIAFLPSQVTIDAGDTVTWTNGGGFHNVEADDASFRSGDPTTAAFVFSHTFATPGTYTYRCAIHGGSGMTGTVVVNGGSAGPQIYLPLLARTEGG